MHCFPNPAPGKLLFPEAGTTWPSGATDLLHPRARTRMCRQANPADRETSQDRKAVEVGAQQGCKYWLSKLICILVYTLTSTEAAVVVGSGMLRDSAFSPSR